MKNKYANKYKFHMLKHGYRVNLVHWLVVKRIFDIMFSLFLLVFFFSWIFPIVAILVKLDSKGSVFFKQERWGKNNEVFLAFKFRTMHINSSDTDHNGNYNQASKDDPRITKVGYFLRRHNIDELPQLLNVIKGEMSIVGPRPHPTLLNLEQKDNIENYNLRHTVKQGITGWAQINGYRGETRDDASMMKKRVEYDLWYISNWSFLLDLKIIILTIWLTLKGDPNAY